MFLNLKKRLINWILEQSKYIGYSILAAQKRKSYKNLDKTWYYRIRNNMYFAFRNCWSSHVGLVGDANFDTSLNWISPLVAPSDDKNWFTFEAVMHRINSLLLRILDTFYQYPFMTLSSSLFLCSSSRAWNCNVFFFKIRHVLDILCFFEMLIWIDK